jgi:hypothetical protein
MVEAFYASISRVKALQSEKIIVMFFKSLSHYAHLSNKLNRKKKRTEESLKTYKKLEENDGFDEEVKASDFGGYVTEVMQMEELRNCKVIFYCAAEDSSEAFRSFFGL